MYQQQQSEFINENRMNFSIKTIEFINFDKFTCLMFYIFSYSYLLIANKLTVLFNFVWLYLKKVEKSS